MPDQGFKSISVSDETYAELQRDAEESHRSIPKFIEYLISEHSKAQGKEWKIPRGSRKKEASI